MSHFQFPFEPYGIQQDFMTKLTIALNEKKVAVFESPKSLSLICGCLSWLQKNQEVEGFDIIEEENIRGDENKSNSKEPAWLRDFTKKAKLEKRLEQKISETKKFEDEEELELLVDYESEDEKKSSVLKSLYSEDSAMDVDEPDELKIYYCSRTHSQISQFVREIQKTEFSKWIKVVSLGSRASLCINEKVLNLKSIERINDKCLDMQQTKLKDAPNCQYLQKDEKVVIDFQASLMVLLKLALISQFLHVLVNCNGYRRSHVLIMQPENLSNLPRLTVLDEAHNIADAISSVHTVQLRGSHIFKASSQLMQYSDRYLTRMSNNNRLYVKQLVHVIEKLKQFCNNVATNKVSQNQLLTSNDFLNSLMMDNINIFKLKEYLQKSKLSQKLYGFSELLEAKNVTMEKIKKKDFEDVCMENNRANLQKIESFLMSMTNSNIDGRILINFENNEVQIKYLLLNPADDLVNDARAIILTGGTMEPLEDFKKQLMPFLNEERFFHFSCGHIIPTSQIQTTVIKNGPSGRLMEFTYDKRNDKSLLNELGNTIINFCNFIKGGIVCFFPSYTFLNVVVDQFNSTGTFERIKKKKIVFLEPKKTSEVDFILEKYSKAIFEVKETGGQLTGALLFCVVSGKLSEGINFSDDLGRAVIMVGLPFPNLASLELKEKLSFLKRSSNNKNVANEFYENMCMKAVNQSSKLKLCGILRILVGRAIRHKGDHATILLLDHRYSQQKIKEKLPKWIRDARIDVTEKFSDAIIKTREVIKDVIVNVPSSFNSNFSNPGTKNIDNSITASSNTTSKTHTSENYSVYTEYSLLPHPTKFSCTKSELTKKIMTSYALTLLLDAFVVFLLVLDTYFFTGVFLVSIKPFLRIYPVYHTLFVFKVLDSMLEGLGLKKASDAVSNQEKTSTVTHSNSFVLFPVNGSFKKVKHVSDAPEVNVAFNHKPVLLKIMGLVLKNN
ncbi:DEAD H (Asp-Glu-Ala-Asp His) box helicase 11 [Clydaea vesicula]|uniref:ATP-dependent DNA helicase CHL1 n=1 Tax=Clydaea vesicula TaxID=447962 RepID=A0AAD5U7Y0_9FUNG|nr:DEAD H (Asp-Glu-Ala-Asp His) box helicase 11 [Clydaea vesicula]